MESERYKIYNADCLEVLKEMPSKSVDLCLTDLPYNEVQRESGGLRQIDNKETADFLTFDLTQAIQESLRICTGSFYFFCATEQVSFIRQLLVKHGLSTRLCIWEKTNPSPMNGEYIWLSGIECCVFAKYPNATFNEHCKNTVWRYPVETNQIHPTQKSLQLIRYLVRTSSNYGDTVLDFTMGSGTCGVACAIEDRNFIGIEKDTHFFNMAEARIKRALGQPADIPQRITTEKVLPLFATV